MQVNVKEPKNPKDHLKAVNDAIATLSAKLKVDDKLNTYRRSVEFVPKSVRRKKKAIHNARHHRRYGNKKR